jgi:hypothetical protein
MLSILSLLQSIYIRSLLPGIPDPLASNPLRHIQTLNAVVSIPVAALEARGNLTQYLAANNTGVSLEELVAAIASPDVPELFKLIVVRAPFPSLSTRAPCWLDPSFKQHIGRCSQVMGLTLWSFFQLRHCRRDRLVRMRRSN